MVGVWDALVMNELMQLTLLEHLADDVAASDELAFDVELGDRRPVGECLNTFANAGVIQHVDVLVGHAQVAKHLGHLSREATLWEFRCAFHEKHNIIRGNGLAYPVLDGCLVGHVLKILRSMVIGIEVVHKFRRLDGA